MKCYCYETEREFIFCVEDAAGEVLKNLQSDAYWTETDGGKFVKSYPTDMGWDDAWYLDEAYKSAVICNFKRLGPSWLRGEFNCEKVLLSLAKTFADNGVEWYIIGSASEFVLGVDVSPHDIDIAVHVRDFYKVKALFTDYVIEPLGDNKGNWLVRYFGKLCIDGASVDVAADDKMNGENRDVPYDIVNWNGYELHIEPLLIRYRTEINRGRDDRIKAIEAYMEAYMNKENGGENNGHQENR